MAFRSRFLAGSLFVSAALATIVACTASGGSDALPNGDSPPDPVPTSSSKLPPPSAVDAAPDDAGSSDARDAARDAKEAGFDAGKQAPAPGDFCKTIDDIFTRSCGICGTQQSICLAKPDGTPGVVSDYSACANELAGGCLPGTTDSEDCGNCGTHKRTCTQYCAWSVGPCMGEPLSSCTPTTTDFTSAGCPSAGTFRTRACGAACTWSTYSSPCALLSFQLILTGTPGDMVSGVYQLRATHTDKRPLGTCPGATLTTTTNYPNIYVELVNPTETTLTLSAWNTAAPNGGALIDTIMGWYDGNVVPADDAARNTCSKGFIKGCPVSLPCGSYRWAGVTGANAITVPPMASVLLFFGSYYPVGGSGFSLGEGPVKLVVRTDSAL